MPTPEKPGMFYLGKFYDPRTDTVEDKPLLYRSKDLTTHAVCVGMTGSGKTGLGITLIEEAALQSIPSIIIDPKGDMGNILLTFPGLTAEEFKPWIDSGEAERKGKSLDSYAEDVARTWREGLQAWDETPERIQKLRNAVTTEIYTPGSQAGIPLSILASFEAPSKEFALDTDAMRERVLSTTSSILGLLGIGADPIKSREHILISTIIAQEWKEGKDIDLPALIRLVQTPEFDKIGAMDVDTFFPLKDRKTLAVRLNNLLAAPGFHVWMEGAPLDIGQLLYTPEKKPKISVISIAHLNDSERMFFVTLFLNQLIAWTRKQPGTSALRAIFYMDEIFGYFPPIAAPPSKLPMITLLKQARAYGLGLVLCTQNPVDLDYKGLSNCGTWFIGRLQTARDKARVTEGLAAASNGEIDVKAIDALMGKMSERVFIMRSIYEKEPILFRTRWALSYLRGPLTLAQIAILSKNEKENSGSFGRKEENIPGGKQTGAPIIPGGIPTYYAVPPGISSSVDYRPFVAGFSKLHFVEKKYDIDAWVDSCVLIDAAQGQDLQWEGCENRPELRKLLTRVPAAGATYQEVSPVLLNEKKYSGLKQELVAYLYRDSDLKLFEYKELQLVSSSGEIESAFRQRVISALKARHDEKCKQIQDAYEKKITALKEKIRKAEEKKGTQQQQSLYQKMEAFLSLATTVIGTFFGRRFTKTTVNQAGTTLRRMGRIGKESQEVTNAEENLRILQQELQDTRSRMESETGAVPLVTDANVLQLDEITIRPRKTDITVEEVALVWWP